MTHEYTLLVGGTIIPGAGPDAEAIAWAHGVILAIGSRSEVLAISRGDSTLFDLAGACVIPLDERAEARWPAPSRLEVGGPADLAVLKVDPRRREQELTAPGLETLALVRGGRVVTGALSGRGRGPTNAGPAP
jgi:predicted amidohydrolase YtcJ